MDRNRREKARRRDMEDPFPYVLSELRALATTSECVAYSLRTASYLEDLSAEFYMNGDKEEYRLSGFYKNLNVNIYLTLSNSNRIIGRVNISTLHDIPFQIHFTYDICDLIPDSNDFAISVNSVWILDQDTMKETVELQYIESKKREWYSHPGHLLDVVKKQSLGFVRVLLNRLQRQSLNQIADAMKIKDSHRVKRDTLVRKIMRMVNNG